MKKMMVLFLLFVGLNATTVLAGENDQVSRYAKEAFDQRFPNAGSVVWNQLKNVDVYQVNFVYNNQILIGYIDGQGEVIAIACEVKNERLPFIITESVAKNYPAYQVNNVMELVKNGELCYLFTLTNEKKMIYARVNSFGDTQVLKTVKKTK